MYFKKKYNYHNKYLLFKNNSYCKYFLNNFKLHSIYAKKNLSLKTKPLFSESIHIFKLCNFNTKYYAQNIFNAYSYLLCIPVFNMNNLFIK